MLSISLLLYLTLGGGLLAFVFMISAMCTSNWIVSCAKFSDIFDSFDALTLDDEQRDLVDRCKAVYMKKALCLRVGLFGYEEDDGLYRSIALLQITSLDAFIQITTSMFILAGIALILSTTFSRLIIKAPFFISQKTISTLTCCKVGFGSMIMSCLFIGIGMIVYTAQHYSIARDVMSFIFHYDEINTQLANEIKPGATSEFLVEERICSVDLTQEQEVALLTAFLNLFIPRFGSSFALGWSAFSIAFASCFCFGIALKKIKNSPNENATFSLVEVSPAKNQT